MMNVLNDWCKVWGVTVNLDKSQIMYFRSASKPLTFFDFKYYGKCMLKVSRYICLALDYMLDLGVTAQLVAKAANRARCLLIAKAKLSFWKFILQICHKII